MPVDVSVPAHADVLILGGGLSGLSLALQLKLADPALDIVVIERHRHPVPESAFKIGESTVEIGAHYFADVLGLREHLNRRQLRKFGFRFFFSEGRDRLDACRELGPSDYLGVPAWQIDRGRFETFLVEEAGRRGIRVEQGARVGDAMLADEPPAGQAPLPHRVSWSRDGLTHQTTARWVIDAMGRASLLKRTLGLAQPSVHDAHSVWFRLGTQLRIDDWGQDPAWRARVRQPERWKSTNHFVGRGYWVWTIPLEGGAHSVGIVADPKIHPWATIDTFERALEWLKTHQPVLHAAIEPLRDRLLDFQGFKRFAHDASQVFSTQRWALAGEAGRFLDPFYSPGSDFIGMGNTMITELVMADRRGDRLAPRVRSMESLMRTYYENTLSLYVGQYGLFGDAELLPLKVLWDYTYYWSLPALLFFRGAIGDAPLLARHAEAMLHSQRLNKAVQRLLAQWGQQREADGRAAQPSPADMLDQCELPWFTALNRALDHPPADRGVGQELEDAADRLSRLAAEIADRARAEGLVSEALDQRLAERPLPDAGPLLTGAWAGEPSAGHAAMGCPPRAGLRA